LAYREKELACNILSLAHGSFPPVFIRAGFVA
jgi:hypothetical protein